MKLWLDNGARSARRESLKRWKGMLEGKEKGDKADNE
jgi:hypothetical protein